MADMYQSILEAEENIRPYIRRTPLAFANHASKQTGAQIYLKCENQQLMGAFKVRGALNALLKLTDEQQQKGVVTASSGNHGTAIAYGLNILKARGCIFLPENVCPAKVDNIRLYTDNIKYHATDSGVTEQFAIQYAQEHQMTYLSPYDHPDVIAGQGTIAIELTEQLQSIDAIIIPTSGGGLASGIGAYIKHVAPKTKIITAYPENSPVLAKWLEAGQPVEVALKDTLSDGTYGNVDPNCITFPLCQKFVDECILVSETEIKSAICKLLAEEHMLAEGAAAVAFAAAIKASPNYQGKNLVAILTGANIDLSILARILAEQVNE